MAAARGLKLAFTGGRPAVLREASQAPAVVTLLHVSVPGRPLRLWVTQVLHQWKNPEKGTVS